VAYEFASKRRPTDTLPGYVALNVTQSQAGLLKSGFLPATFSPFHIDTATSLGVYGTDEASRKDFLRRWQLLQKFDERLRNDSSLAAKAFRDYHNYYQSGVSLMSDPRAARVFRIEEAERERYGKNVTGDACISKPATQNLCLVERRDTTRARQRQRHKTVGRAVRHKRRLQRRLFAQIQHEQKIDFHKHTS
jgi:hypothetical protein